MVGQLSDSADAARKLSGHKSVAEARRPAEDWRAVIQRLGRRPVLIGLVAALLPVPARAQKPPTLPRIGWLSAGSEPDPFLEALVTLIVASLTAVRAARAIKDIPILYTISGDPIEAGLAQSLPRPGGNLTGSTFLSLEIAGKRVELLKQALPHLRSFAALSNTDHPGEKSELRATETAAQRLGINLVYVAFSQSPFGASPELDKALETVRRARPDAMIVFPEGATMANRVSLAAFAIAQRLPSMFGWSEYVSAGGLMSYGASLRETHVRLAGYADKILKGAKPGDLPVEQPTRFELVLNLRTARELGLTIPPALLLQADHVLE